MGNDFENLSDANQPLDHYPSTSIDGAAYWAIHPDNRIPGWDFGTYPSSSVPDHDFDTLVLSPAFAPTNRSYAALKPLPYHSQGLNPTSQALSTSSLFTTGSIASQSQSGTRYGSEGLSPETVWSLESAVSAAAADAGFSPGNHHEVPMPPHTPPHTVSSQSKRSRRTGEKHSAHGQASSSSSSSTKKRRKGKDQSRTEAPARTSKSEPTKNADTAVSQTLAKADGKIRPAKSTNGKSVASTSNSKNTDISRRRGNSSRKGSLVDTPSDEPQIATQRERNRMAATRCRAKTKAAIRQLELDERSISDRRDNLATTRDSLRAEVLHYRSLLLQHQDCNCVHIRQYLEKAAGLIAKTGGQHPIWGQNGDGGEWADYQEPCELGNGSDDDYEDEEEEVEGSVN